jgi:hypothetical protein
MLFILRDAMLENFGTHGAGSVLSSLQGALSTLARTDCE